MNFLELCERVAEETNDRPLVFTSVDLGKSDGAFIITDPFKRKVIRAVQSAHAWICNFSAHWTFYNKRGALWTLTSGTREYFKPYIHSVEWDSLYLTLSGSTARWPIYREFFDQWQQRERMTVETTSIPIYLVDAPRDRWIFWPTPNDTYVLNGVARYTPVKLENAGDEPMWENRFDDVLIWLAVAFMEGRVKSDSTAVQALSTKTNEAAFRTSWASFLSEYLPPPRGPC